MNCKLKFSSFPYTQDTPSCDLRRLQIVVGRSKSQRGRP